MKDIIVRVTSAEKKLITNLRDLNVFEFKDLFNELRKLVVVAKLTGEDSNYEYINNLINLLHELLLEREDETLKKLNRKRKRTSNIKSGETASDSEKEDKAKSSDNKDINPIDASNTIISTSDIKKNEDAKKGVVKEDDKSEAEHKESDAVTLNTPLLEKLKARKFKNFLSTNINNNNQSKKDK